MLSQPVIAHTRPQMTTIPNSDDPITQVTLETTTTEDSRRIEAAVREAFDYYVHPPHIDGLLRVILRMDRELAERK